ncbi:MAG: DNA polymerase III subunit epsilon [Glaciecola sp.]|jgi:DNA polymerase-3 subunit epsilon
MTQPVGHRQIVLDTETTGMNREAGQRFTQGHRIIEIGCVEMIDRKFTGNHFHVYLNPEQEIDPEAIAVHGITNEFLVDKPLFKDIADDFIKFIEGAELVIHNAPFDVGFMDVEFAYNPATALTRTEKICTVLDTLVLAKKMRPGQRNNLDALCKEYGIDNSHRELHGALLDAEILADVYLLMTGGQESLTLDQHQQYDQSQTSQKVSIRRPETPLKVLRATTEELTAHERRLDIIEQASGTCLYRQ